MPELPEVEQFRKTLLPLVSDSDRLELSLVSESPPRNWILAEDVAKLNEARVVCKDVLRKGKQLCMVLKSLNSDNDLYYLFLHMGMTGSIQSPGVQTGWGHEGLLKGKEGHGDAEEAFPPKYAHLTFCAGRYRAAFSDSRKFGKCELSSNLSIFNALAPDALIDLKDESNRTRISSKIVNQSTGIKALMLDQKRAVSGVGNWVADEVLYQIRMHPDQSYLSCDEATELLTKLYEILACAVDSLKEGNSYPASWLFHYRWTKAGKDANGQMLTFLKSGGRTSAIVLPLQRLRKSQKPGFADQGQTQQGEGSEDKKPVAKKRKRPLRPKVISSDEKNLVVKEEDQPSPKRSNSRKRSSVSPGDYKGINGSKKTKVSAADQVINKSNIDVSTNSRRRSPRLVSP